jgi:hypothetical protein
MMNLVASMISTTEAGGLGLHQRIVTIEGVEINTDRPSLENTRDPLLRTGGTIIIHVEMIKRGKKVSLKTEGLDSIHHLVRMKRNKGSSS